MPVKGPNGKINPRFDCIELDGIGAVGGHVKNGQVFVNKHEPKEKKLDFNGAVTTTQAYLPAPLTYKSLNDGVIDKVCVSSNGEAGMNIKVNIRQTRRPELGDKFSSRHG